MKRREKSRVQGKTKGVRVTTKKKGNEKEGGKLGWGIHRRVKKKGEKRGCAFICEMRYLSSDGLTYPSSDFDVSGLN